MKQCDDKGKLNLYYFDESGFNTVPTIPYAWQPIGKTSEILSVRSPQLNVLCLINRKNEAYFNVVEGRVKTDNVIEVIDCFAASYYLSQENKVTLPCVVVLDNASIHRSKAFRQQKDKWEAYGVFFHFLPTYSPELNLIEILWKKIKYEWLPLESYEHLKKQLKKVLNDFGNKLRINFA